MNQRPVAGRRTQVAGQRINEAIEDGYEFYFNSKSGKLWWRSPPRGVPMWTQFLFGWMIEYEEEIKDLLDRHGKRVTEEGDIDHGF